MKSHPMVLLRHAQSEWNVANRFTGWADVGLTQAGEDEARAAGRLLAQAGFVFDEAHASMLGRTHRTLDLVLAEMGTPDLPRHLSWQLNERHYGALQALNKRETAQRYGEAQFQRWRRGYRDRPPMLDHADPRHPRFDPRYAGIAPDRLPAGESLADTRKRVHDYWSQNLVPRLQSGARTIVASHANTLRALLMQLQSLSETEVENLELPTGTPRVCEFDARGALVGMTMLKPQAAARAA